MGWFDAVLGGLNSFFGAKEKESADRAKNKSDYMWSSRLARYQAELDDYYKQRDRGETRAGAAEFAKFSSLDQWAPGYQQTFVPPTVPTSAPQPPDYSKKTKKTKGSP